MFTFTSVREATAGILEGAFILIFVGVISTRAMLLVVDCKYKILNKQSTFQKLVPETDEKPQQNKNDELEIETKAFKGGTHHEMEFGDIGQHALGRSGIVLVDSLVVLSQIGFCCAYLIFISENLANFLPRFNRYHYLIGMIIPLVILANVRQLHNLSIFSLFADFANVFAYCVVFWFDFDHFRKIGADIHNFSASGLPFFIGIAIYCYEGAGMILSLESSVAKECREKFYGVFKLAMMVITSLYVTFGICGYLSFGESTESIITLNLPNVMMFPVSRILELRLFKDPKNEDYYKCTMMRSSLVGVTVIIVVAIPSFSTLMALIGSSCCILLALILPGVFHLKIFEGELTICQKFMDYLIILLGIIGGFFGTRDAVKRLFAGENVGL